MSAAPTGEAVNYETTIAELEALADQQRGHLDQCQAALTSLTDAKARIGDMQDSYRSSSAAAANISDHLGAKHLDGVTLANAGTTVDAMPAGKVDVMFDQLEVMEAEAQTRLGEAEVALGATEENLRHIRETYGDAHATVAGNLGGDSSFLDGGGGGGGSQGNLERQLSGTSALAGHQAAVEASQRGPAKLGSPRSGTAATDQHDRPYRGGRDSAYGPPGTVRLDSDI